MVEGSVDAVDAVRLYTACVHHATPGYDWNECVNSHRSQLSLAIPSLVDAINTSQWVVMLCGWE